MRNGRGCAQQPRAGNENIRIGTQPGCNSPISPLECTNSCLFLPSRMGFVPFHPKTRDREPKSPHTGRESVQTLKFGIQVLFPIFPLGLPQFLPSQPTFPASPEWDLCLSHLDPRMFQPLQAGICGFVPRNDGSEGKGMENPNHPKQAGDQWETRNLGLRHSLAAISDFPGWNALIPVFSSSSRVGFVPLLLK